MKIPVFAGEGCNISASSLRLVFGVVFAFRLGWKLASNFYVTVVSWYLCLFDVEFAWEWRLGLVQMESSEICTSWVSPSEYYYITSCLGYLGNADNVIVFFSWIMHLCWTLMSPNACIGCSMLLFYIFLFLFSFLQISLWLVAVNNLAHLVIRCISDMIFWWLSSILQLSDNYATENE